MQIFVLIKILTSVKLAITVVLGVATFILRICELITN